MEGLIASAFGERSIALLMNVIMMVDHRLHHHRQIAMTMIARIEVEVDQVVAHQNAPKRDERVVAIAAEKIVLLVVDIVLHIRYLNH